MVKNKMKALLALDGSKHSKALVKYMSGILPPEYSEITLLNIFGNRPRSFREYEMAAYRLKYASIADELEVKQRASMQAFMEMRLDDLFEAGFPGKAINIQLQQRERGVAEDIRDMAIGGGYDLVAVGRYGNSPVREFIFGGITHHLLAKIDDRALCMVSGEPASPNLLLAIDSTDASQKAIEFTCLLARKKETEVEIFHAVRRLRLPPYIDCTVGFEESEKRMMDDERETMEPIMERARYRLIESGFDETRVKLKLVMGVPGRAVAIVEEARKNEVGGIILGRRKQSKAEKLFMGRVGDKVTQLVRKRAVFIVG